MTSFDGRSVLVTGAGSGIGRASALAFAEAGAKVTVIDLDPSGGAETVNLIERDGGVAQFVQADVTDEGSVEAAIKETVRAYGRLDAAHNNAGIDDVHVAVEDYQLSDWQKILAVNLTGVFLCIKHELPVLLAGGGGAIVNTSSGLSKRGAPRLAGYISTKAGVLGLTLATAVEYAERGIRVNAVLPGATETPLTAKYDEATLEVIRPLHPMNRLAKPAEIAAAAVWLCSEEASFVTGALMPVDGGHLARA